MSQWCLACGLCCRGVLFDFGFAQAKEYQQHAAAWEQAGVRCDSATGYRFHLPCHAYQAHDGRCACYEIRPATCAVYRCALLKRHANGEMSDAECKRVLARIHRLWTGLQAKLRAHEAVDANAAFFQQLEQFREWFGQTRDPESSHLMAEQRALLMLFQHYFWDEPPQA